MNGTGYFSEGFDAGIGDFIEHDAEVPAIANGTPPPLDNGIGPVNPPQNGRAKKETFPSVEGPGTCAELVNRYKKAILSRQTAWRDLNERWIAAAPKSGTLLDYSISVLFLLSGKSFCLALLFAMLPSVTLWTLAIQDWVGCLGKHVWWLGEFLFTCIWPL